MSNFDSSYGLPCGVFAEYENTDHFLARYPGETDDVFWMLQIIWHPNAGSAAVHDHAGKILDVIGSCGNAKLSFSSSLKDTIAHTPLGSRTPLSSDSGDDTSDRKIIDTVRMTWEVSAKKAMISEKLDQIRKVVDTGIVVQKDDLSPPPLIRQIGYAKSTHM